MRILQLNVWNGRMKGAIPRFLKQHDFDIICLQEACWGDNFETKLEYFIDDLVLLQRASGLAYVFKTSNWGIDINNYRLEHGNVILSRFPIAESTKLLVHGIYEQSDLFGSNDHAYYAQKVVLENDIVVVNYHGYWRPNPIGDDETIHAMRQVAGLVKNERRPVIVCGDMNIISASPAMRELNFLTDLTDRYRILTTLQNIKFIKDVACDHILINSQISVQNFAVIQDLISDHKALALEFEVNAVHA